MDAIVIDTDVLSYLFKQDTRGELYRPHLEGKLGVLSFMTLAELEYWAEIRSWGALRRAEMAAFLEPYLVIESDHSLARKWAGVRALTRQSGSHIDTADAWIAATALLYGIPLVTHNTSHFTKIPDLQIISSMSQ